MSEAMTHQFLRLSLASSWAPTSNVIPLLLGGVLLILPTSRHPSCMRTHTHTLTIKRICTHMTSVLQLWDINCAEQGTQYTCAHTRPSRSLQIIMQSTLCVPEVFPKYFTKWLFKPEYQSKTPPSCQQNNNPAQQGKNTTTVGLYKLQITNVVTWCGTVCRD